MICLELHAHLNGSLSESTMTKLQLLQSEASKSAWEVNPRRSNKESTNPLDDKGSNSDANKVIKSFFSKFKEIYALTSTLSQLRIAVTETLKDFRADGVVYLELRSTPRAVPNEYTKKEYIESVVGVIREFNNEQDEVITRFIVSIDRRHSIHESLAVIEMVKEINDKLIVGVDLCGDPTVNSFSILKPIFERAREIGMKITLHCGEIEGDKEVKDMMEFGPDRIGHATWLSEEMVDLVIQKSIGVEICMTSNVLCQTVPSYQSHHFKQFYKSGVKMCICTDDKGIFGKGINEEYGVLKEEFGIGEREALQVARGAIDIIFEGENVRKVLNEKFDIADSQLLD